MENRQDRLGNFLVQTTERFLTWHKRRKLLAKEIARTNGANGLLGIALEFLQSLPSTLLIVFFLNLYIIQAYVIPSGSMEDTLLINDKILVNKFPYGPEVWLGSKSYLPALQQVQRADIVTFANPDYQSKGILHETARRVIFFVSLTLIDIGKEGGKPPVDLLIKRAVGYDGDRIIFRDGDISIRAMGERDFLAEPHFKFINNIEYNQKRVFSRENSDLVTQLAEYRAYRLAGLATPVHLEHLQDLTQERGVYALRVEHANAYARTRARLMIHALRQQSIDEYYLQSRGIYVPVGYILPLGDNRDNSHDGRYFGVVARKQVQGKAVFRFWPWRRIGGIE
jgi:signal peptidase I